MHIHSLLYESFSQYKQHVLRNMDIDPEAIDSWLDRFKKQVSRGTITGEQKDINYWKKLPLNDLLQAVKSAESKTTNRQKKKMIKNTDGIRIGKFGNWEAIIPTSTEASKCYGADTKWCTAGKENDRYFSEYQNKQMLLVYLIPENPEYDAKWALVIDPKYGNVLDAYDELDNFKTTTEFEQDTGLSAKKIAETAVKYNTERMEKLEQFAKRNYHAALRYVVQTGGNVETVKEMLATTPDGVEMYLDMGGKDIDYMMNNGKFPTGEFARNYKYQLSGIARRVPPDKWSDRFRQSMRDAGANV